jgi:hypothetical protein
MQISAHNTIRRNRWLKENICKRFFPVNFRDSIFPFPLPFLLSTGAISFICVPTKDNLLFNTDNVKLYTIIVKCTYDGHSSISVNVVICYNKFWLKHV